MRKFGDQLLNINNSLDATNRCFIAQAGVFKRVPNNTIKISFLSRLSNNL